MKGPVPTVLSRMGLYHSIKGNPRVGSVCIENAFREAEKSEDVGLIAPIGFDLTVSHLFRREWVSLVDNANRVLPFIEQADRQTEFFGRPPNPYSIIKGNKGLAMAHLGDFSGGESCLAEALLLPLKLITYSR